MDREPSPFPELKYEEAEVEHERGISRLFMNEEEVDDVDEYGVTGFRYENGELLRALDEDAIVFSWVDSATRSLEEANKLVKKRIEEGGGGGGEENVSVTSHGLIYKSKEHCSKIFIQFL